MHKNASLAVVTHCKSCIWVFIPNAIQKLASQSAVIFAQLEWQIIKHAWYKSLCRTITEIKGSKRSTFLCIFAPPR